MATTITVFPATTLHDGQVLSLAPTAIPLGVSSASLLWDVTQMTDPATSYSFTVDVSPDGGTTWFNALSATTVGQPGGFPNSRTPGQSGANLNGNPGNAAGWSNVMLDTTNPNRQIRAQITAVGTFTIGPGTLTTS